MWFPRPILPRSRLWQSFSKSCPLPACACSEATRDAIATIIDGNPDPICVYPVSRVCTLARKGPARQAVCCIQFYRGKFMPLDDFGRLRGARTRPADGVHVFEVLNLPAGEREHRHVIRSVNDGTIQ